VLAAAVIVVGLPGTAALARGETATMAADADRQCRSPTATQTLLGARSMALLAR
jgi:hypothetical protein